MMSLKEARQKISRKMQEVKAQQHERHYAVGQGYRISGMLEELHFALGVLDDLENQWLELLKLTGPPDDFKDYYDGHVAVCGELEDVDFHLVMVDLKWLMEDSSCQ